MKKFTFSVLFSLLFLPFVFSQAVIINHLTSDLSAIPQQWIDSAKIKLKVTYQHTSHGSQLVSGLTAIEATYGGVYNYTYSGYGLDTSVFFNDYGMPGASDLGHNGDLAWRDATIEILDNPECNRNVVIWSWCGGVSDNDSSGIYTYLNAMSQLETDYPDVKFVYMTGHLDGSGADGNLNLMNDLIRNYCINNNKILFDFADIESFDPDAAQNYMEWCCLDGLNYDSTCNNPWDGANWGEEWVSANPNHSYVDVLQNCSSCAHSSDPSEAKINCVQKGNALWWLLATLAGWDQNTASISEDIGSELFSIYPNPANDRLTVVLKLRYPAILELYNLSGQKVYTQNIAPSTTTLNLDVSFLNSGVYFCTITTQNKTVSRKFTVK